jgi:hypothetical protein
VNCAARSGKGVAVTEFLACGGSSLQSCPELHPSFVRIQFSPLCQRKYAMARRTSSYARTNRDALATADTNRTIAVAFRLFVTFNVRDFSVPALERSRAYLPGWRGEAENNSEELIPTGGVENNSEELIPTGGTVEKGSQELFLTPTPVKITPRSFLLPRAWREGRNRPTRESSRHRFRALQP